MARFAKSEDVKRRVNRAKIAEKYQNAVKTYRELETKGLKPKIRDVARKADVNHVTLGRHLRGERTIDEFNATKTKLSSEQEAVLVDWIIELANRNLGLQPHVVLERANQLYQSTNPSGKLGVSWTGRFIHRHHDKLARHWSRPLDKVRALSATPEVMDNYFRLYKSIVGENGEKISPDRQFAYDESGIMRGMGQRTRVVSSRNNKAAKVNRGGSRELISFVPIIRGDGKMVTALTVFPGKLLRTEWCETNPGKFATTISAKGYMTDLLGEAFIRLFHKLTADLEEGGPRLLHVDSHSSHVSLPLLEFAVQHNIIILGYPPHTTNLTQGLDVVIFSAFKNAYAAHAAAHLADTGKEVTKRDFLTILHHATSNSFTEGNILAAWRKTGLRPVCRAAISDTELAPSRAFSTTQALPLPPPSPICAIVDAIHRQNRIRDTSTLNSSPPSRAASVAMPLSPVVSTYDSSCSDASVEHLCDDFSAFDLEEQLGISPPPPFLPDYATHMACDILCSLKATSMAPLLDIDTLTSECELPPPESGPLPLKLAWLLQKHTGMPDKELWLLVKEEFLKLVPRADRQLALNLLQHTYCQQMQRKLANKEDSNPNKGLHKLPGFKNGVIYTSDEVLGILAKAKADRVAAEAEKAQKKAEKELRQEAQKWLDTAKEVQKEQHARLVAVWKALPPSRRPTRCQPAKPPLLEIPERFKKALEKAPSKNQSRTRAARDFDEASFSGTDYE